MSEAIPNPCTQDLKRYEKNRQLRVYWRHHINAFRQSNLTQKEYCKIHKLDHSKFKNWLHRLKPDELMTPTDFIPIQVNGSASSDHSKRLNEDSLGPALNDSTAACPELKLGFLNELVLSIPKGFDVSTLRQVVKVLTR